MGNLYKKALKTALEWHIDHGANEAMAAEAWNHTDRKADIMPVPALQKKEKTASAHKPAPLGKSEALQAALEIVNECHSLEDLKEALNSFEGLSIKKTATQMVFADGNPKAHVMLVGEAPGAEEDRMGRPFVGASGQLLDRILECIGISRSAQDPDKSIYISNILNWRPPGNRTPTQAEIEVSLPFIERHIQLAAPRYLILCGSVAAKSLLGRPESISRLRKTWHDYSPQTQGLLKNAAPVKALATYHPSYLLRTPQQKKAAWDDMLELDKELRSNAVN